MHTCSARLVSLGLLATLPLLSTPLSAQPAAGEFKLHSDGELFDLEANEASLRAILDAVEGEVGVRLAIYSERDKKISARHGGLTFDQLLTRLGVSYALMYEQQRDGAIQLADAMVFDVAAPMVPTEALQAITRQIRNLADDNIRHNAEKSWHTLLQIGPSAVPALEQTLAGGDYQARQLAAQVLVFMQDPYAPSVRFLEVLVEGLRDDMYPYGQHADGDYYYTGLSNARNAAEYFAEHPEMVPNVESLFVRALDSEDGQERFLSAVALAGAGRITHARKLVQVLAPHLRDNNLSSDARLAEYALLSLGPSARRYLEPYLDSDDEQQIAFARRVRNGASGIWQPEAKHYMRSASFNLAGWSPEFFPDRDGRYAQDYEPEPAEQDPNAPYVYTVLTGDTLDGLAKLFAVNAEEILRLNGLPDPAAIVPGLALIIPLTGIK